MALNHGLKPIKRKLGFWHRKWNFLKEYWGKLEETGRRICQFGKNGVNSLVFEMGRWN